MGDAMLKRTLLGGAAAAILFTATSAPALAGSSAELLKRLHEKGILTDEEYRVLFAQEQAEAAGQAPAAAASSSSDDGLNVKRTESGIGLVVGDATIKFSGSINAYYVNDNPDTAGPTTAVGGGIASVGGDSSNAVRNGLLPGFLLVANSLNSMR